MTETKSSAAAPSRAVGSKRRRHDPARILSRDAIAYALDTSNIEVEALSDDIIAAVREHGSRIED